MEEGFPNATGCEQLIKGLLSFEFCLHTAGMVDYSEFSVFVPFGDALQPTWLVDSLRNISNEQKDLFRRNMSNVLQPIFEYYNDSLGGIGPVPSNGAVNYIWIKV